MPVALTRGVSRSIGRCELTHLARETIDVGLAVRQHHAYEACLESLGCRILPLPPEPDLPDAVFVEDTAVVLDETAVITRPGAESRRPETGRVAEALKSFRPLSFISDPGTLDGGDVLRIGRELFIGRSARSNPEGIRQMRLQLEPFGYSIREMPVKGCLHLKSAVTLVSEQTVLINADWLDARYFNGLEILEADPGEPYAANALLINGTAVYSQAYPATRRRLEKQGIPLAIVDVSELAKAEGAVTCCSIIFDTNGADP
ncbi:dimethylargininase [bacterium]|nr:dimethylargininase [bacterium]